MRLRGEYDVATEQDRIQLIANLIEEGAKSPAIRELSLNILRQYGAREKNELDEVKAIFDYIKKNIQYRKDVRCKDSYHTPERILQLHSGDCDDFSILTDSMLMSVGYEVGLRIMASRADMPFHHIYSLVYLKKYGWTALDGTNKSYGVGDQPKYAKKKDFVLQCGD
jgi:transglutaminase-like putative cysteine protease